MPGGNGGRSICLAPKPSNSCLPVSEYILKRQFYNMFTTQIIRTHIYYRNTITTHSETSVLEYVLLHKVSIESTFRNVCAEGGHEGRGRGDNENGREHVHVDAGHCQMLHYRVHYHHRRLIAVCVCVCVCVCLCVCVCVFVCVRSCIT